jgi:hypothetical protein
MSSPDNPHLSDTIREEVESTLEKFSVVERERFERWARGNWDFAVAPPEFDAGWLCENFHWDGIAEKEFRNSSNRDTCEICGRARSRG